MPRTSTTSQTMKKRLREESPHGNSRSYKRVQKAQSSRLRDSPSALLGSQHSAASDGIERATDISHTLDVKALRSSILEQFASQRYHNGLRTNVYTEGVDDAVVEKAYVKFAEEEVTISGKAREHLEAPRQVCVRMLLKKGLSTSETFWFESWFRRKTVPPTTSNPRATPMDPRCCTPAMRHLWTGDPVAKSFKRHYSQKKVTVLVSDTSIDLHVVVNRGLIVHIGVPMPHPHYFLMALTGRVPRPYSVAKQLDATSNVAVALSNARLTVDESYFQRLLAHRYSGPATQTFNANPRIAMIEGLQQEQSTGTKRAFAELPAVILDWLKKELGTEDLERIESVITSRAVSCLQVVQQLMTKKGNENRTLGLDKKRAGSELNFERTAIRRNETPIKTHCEVCKAHVIIDDAPLFGTEEPVVGVYIARITKACKSGCCSFRKNGTRGKTPRSIDLIPADPTVKFMRQLTWRKLCDEQKREGDK
ncbi:hypothetical protein BDV96DRAFT_601547 [Lophiotrema nucula]|uniref:Uncharacterized protein n=1 Tax=Lophiotrema nucula TaxID=690887 RepID=A0A6A5Z305_9PLEO|nr:hypothetical protein BDV96DRAFT_601547 [Lophiotrema nucula]